MPQFKFETVSGVFNEYLHPQLRNKGIVPSIQHEEAKLMDAMVTKAIDRVTVGCVVPITEILDDDFEALFAQRMQIALDRAWRVMSMMRYVNAGGKYKVEG